MPTSHIDLPQLCAARVLTPGGPYEAGSVLSLAFVDPSVGRLCPHDPVEVRPPAASGEPLVPETISVMLLGPAAPYAGGETVTLSFVQPSLARIHRAPGAERTVRVAETARELRAALEVRPPQGVVEEPLQRGDPPPIMRLEWTQARVGRLCSLAEKLLAVDRLGWYRHALAMRLLLPDEIVVARAEANESVARNLRALKIAATEALGTPLLSALMPNFALDEEWLRSIETPALARAVAALRESLGPHVGEPGAYVLPVTPSHVSIGAIGRAEFDSVSSAGLDAFIASLIPTDGGTPELRVQLHAYRAASIELFGQIAQAPAAVRTTRLATPNPVLDERLAAVASEVDGAFGRLAVA